MRRKGGEGWGLGWMGVSTVRMGVRWGWNGLLLNTRFDILVVSTCAILFQIIARGDYYRIGNSIFLPP